MFKKRPVNKIFLGLITPFVATLFVACSSTPQKSNQSPEIKDFVCTFPDDPNTKAPEWICNPTEATGGLLSARGSSKSANPMLQEQKCLGSARLAMAQTLEVSVKGLFQEYAESTGSGENETLDQMSKAVTEQLTQATLRGTSAKRQVASPNGTYYCLVAMEADKVNAIAQAVEDAARTSKGNEQALWQKFQAKNSLEEMDRKLKELDEKNQ